MHIISTQLTAAVEKKPLECTSNVSETKWQPHSTEAKEECAMQRGLQSRNGAKQPSKKTPPSGKEGGTAEQITAACGQHL